MSAVRISDLQRLFVSLAGAALLSAMCLGAALAPAHFVMTAVA